MNILRFLLYIYNYFAHFFHVSCATVLRGVSFADTGRRTADAVYSKLAPQLRCIVQRGHHPHLPRPFPLSFPLPLGLFLPFPPAFAACFMAEAWLDLAVPQNTNT